MRRVCVAYFQSVIYDSGRICYHVFEAVVQGTTEASVKSSFVFVHICLVFFYYIDFLASTRIDADLDCIGV
jgi:hypothetical protein